MMKRANHFFYKFKKDDKKDREVRGNEELRSGAYAGIREDRKSKLTKKFDVSFLPDYLIKLYKFLVLLAFAGYMIILFYLLFFSAYRQSMKGTIDYNLVPLKTISNYFYHFDSVGWFLLTDNFFGNILAFVPFGLLLPELIKGKKKIFYAWFAIGSSFGIEVSQLFFRVGTLDVDDILLNTLGAFIGYSIYQLLTNKIWIKANY
ncbi:VanZ family protein [Aquibacillus salsiterrae]|uniref:VanZ family protein n=1 Tax=Aquibacillus salsiterrae TaxID=2950439 RepID=A0A9X3WD53_9BACI|nr:VanZ family protein [Aquibacillus salsiterrae]MDC3416241.1 VanZ family protein [Aquibacillus salsiterrae]